MVTHIKLLLCESGGNQPYFILREQGMASKLQKELNEEAHTAAQRRWGLCSEGIDTHACMIYITVKALWLGLPVYYNYFSHAYFI